MASAYDSTTDFLQGSTSQALTLASNNASRIWGLENTTAHTRDPSVRAVITKPDLGEAPKFSDLFGGDSTDTTLRYLDDQAAAWMSKYFPAHDGCFKSITEDSLCSILSGAKPYGLDKSILELVWHQARDRASRTKLSERANIAATFSALGFSMPPGAMIDAMAQSERSATDAAIEVSREQAIKDADIKIEIFKLGLQLSVQLKTGIMASLTDFYRMWISVPDKDIERARIRAMAQASLASSLSSYYNVELGFQELKLRADQLKAGIDIDVDRNAIAKQGNFMGIAGPLASAVNAFAGVAGDAAQAGGSLTAQVETI